MDEFDIPFKFLSFSGIGRNSVPTKKCYRNCFSRFATIFGTLIILCIKVYRITVYLCTITNRHAKLVISSICFNLLDLLTWHVLYRRNEKILQVVKRIGNDEQAIFKVKRATLKKWISLITFLAHINPLVLAIVSMFTFDDKILKAKVGHYFFGQTVNSTIDAYVIMSFYTVLIYFFCFYIQNSAIIIYVFLCVKMRTNLKKFCELFMLTSSFNASEGHILRLYRLKSQLRQSIRDMDQAFALPILLVIITNVLMIFRSLSCVFGLVCGNQDSPSSKVYTIFITTNSLVSMFAVVLSSSEVLKKQADVDQHTEELQYRLLTSHVDAKALYLLNSMKNEKRIPLTGWKFLTLDSSFLLAACGNILTYSLLILQLNNECK